MEILATVEYRVFYISTLLFFSIVSLFFLVVSVHAIIDIVEYHMNEALPALIVCIGISLSFGYTTYLAYKEGAIVEYKAKITDFNEVYKNGYEIIDQEGKIYTLEKK